MTESGLFISKYEINSYNSSNKLLICCVLFIAFIWLKLFFDFLRISLLLDDSIFLWGSFGYSPDSSVKPMRVENHFYGAGRATAGNS
jgi:hypothetical protein